jgi:hypothetical protein
MTTAFEKFRAQRYQARRRGIDFQLTFDEWYNWWLANGVDKNMGVQWTSTTRLCMCRFNDTGPYALNNIYLATHSQNIKDMFKTGHVYKPTHRWGDKEITLKELREVYNISDNQLLYFNKKYYDFNNKTQGIFFGKKWKRHNITETSLEDYIKQHSRYPDPYIPTHDEIK